MISFALLLMHGNQDCYSLEMSCDNTRWLDLFLYVTVRGLIETQAIAMTLHAGGLGHPELIVHINMKLLFLIFLTDALISDESACKQGRGLIDGIEWQ